MSIDIAQVCLLLIVAGLLLRLLRAQRVAVRVARDTKSEAASAAASAAGAAAVARRILDRLEVLGSSNQRAAARIESAAGVVADDLAAAHDRANAVGGREAGAAADAAATSPVTEHS